MVFQFVRKFPTPPRLPVPLPSLQLIHLPFGRLLLLSVVLPVVSPLEEESEEGESPRVSLRSPEVELLLLVHRFCLLPLPMVLGVLLSHLLLGTHGSGSKWTGQLPRRRRGGDQRGLGSYIVLPVLLVVSLRGVSVPLVEPAGPRGGEPAELPHLVSVHSQLRVLTVRLLRPLD